LSYGQVGKKSGRPNLNQVAKNLKGSRRW